MFTAFPGKEAAVPWHKHCPGLGEGAQAEDFHLDRGIVPQQSQELRQPRILPVPQAFPLQRIPPWELSSSSSPARHPKYSPVERRTLPRGRIPGGFFFLVIECWKKPKLL